MSKNKNKNLTKTFKNVEKNLWIFWVACWILRKVLRKNVPYGTIKSHKKVKHYPLFRNYIFRISIGGEWNWSTFSLSGVIFVETWSVAFSGTINGTSENICNVKLSNSVLTHKVTSFNLI